MGDFRIVIEAAGGHGCDRNAKQGDEVRGCGSETCPDCITARFVSELQRAGIRPKLALYTHWPAAMAKHELVTNADGTLTCLRCQKTFASPTEAAAALEGHSDLACSAGVGYPAAREVVDDLTERDVKYPSGAFRRATPKRVKGSF